MLREHVPQFWFPCYWLSLPILPYERQKLERIESTVLKSCSDPVWDRTRDLLSSAQHATTKNLWWLLVSSTLTSSLTKHRKTVKIGMNDKGHVLLFLVPPERHLNFRLGYETLRKICFGLRVIKHTKFIHWKFENRSDDPKIHCQLSSVP